MLMVYAKDGVCSSTGGRPRMSDIRHDDPREMLWLLNDRTDFSAEGWASLLGGRERLAVEIMEGVDHFSLVDEGVGMGRLGGVLGGFLLG